jgi:hypothetical protein
MLPHHGVLAGDGNLYLTYGNGPGPNGMTAGAVWKLNTGSGVWTNVSPPTGSYGFAGVTVDRSRPGTVMVSTMDKWWPHDEIYRSTNSGSTWTAISDKGTWDSSDAPYVGNSIGHWIGDLEIDPFNSDRVLYVTGSGIRGTDNVTPADSGGATAWTIRAGGLEETAIIDLVAPPGGASLISGLGDIGGFRHDDLTREPSMNFQNPRFGNTTGIDFAQAAPNTVVRAGTGGAPYGAYSTDGGTSWKPFASTPSGAQAGTVAVSADGSTFVWTPSNQAASYSRNSGTSWSASTGLPAGAKVVADRASAGTFYALSGGTLYVSTNGGASFTTRSGGLANGALEAVPGNAGDLWIAAGSGLFHSTNGGTSFAKAGGGVGSANQVGFGKAAPGQSYPALYLTGTVNNVAGVFRSDNGGTGWVRINDDQHQWGSQNRAITGDPDVYGRVYIGTNGRGIQVGDPA